MQQILTTCRRPQDALQSGAATCPGSNRVVYVMGRRVYKTQQQCFGGWFRTQRAFVDLSHNTRGVVQQIHDTARVARLSLASEAATAVGVMAR